MSVWRSFPRARNSCRIAALACAAAVAALPARAGHEVPYYPSFYPQEIRIESIDPANAAREFGNASDPLHVYLGTSPHFADGVPPNLKAVDSLSSFITATVNPRSPRLQTREARCGALTSAASALAKHPGVVTHPYPVTPYHADYIGHVDRISEARAGPLAATATDSGLVFRAADAVGTAAVSHARTSATAWDIGFDEVPLADVMRQAGLGVGAWPAPPMAKEGWFQAYHLLRTGSAEEDDRERADALYNRLTRAEFSDLAEKIDLERRLVSALTHSCHRAMVGYRLRREFYSDDFSNGVENIAFDSQSGFNTPVFVRTIKLKDFPWNGWLRIGIDAPPAAAWNPVAGFTDGPGRLVWSTIGDDAFLPIPYNSRWTQNRAEIRLEDHPAPSQSMRIPADAVIPEAGTGRIGPIGSGRGAMNKVTYRLLASAFQDGTEMEVADFLYPYALAFRWGVGKPGDAAFNPEIAAATESMRGQLKGVRVVRVDETRLPIADLVFTYRSPIVEVYLDYPSPDDQERALVAPPWSSTPWHVLALMEAAVERGIGAFSQQEAKRRAVPWLDLVRDPAQREKMHALVKEFASTGYIPPAIETFVTTEAAKARWEALDKFVQTRGHLLVTNGPYHLKSWSPEAIVFEVDRDFSYPIGLGLFDTYAYPPHALITDIQRTGDRIVLAAEVEFAIKQQRDRRIVREPLTRETLRETFPIRPVTRYVIVAEDGTVAGTGNAQWEADGRFAVALPNTLPPGAYIFLGGIFLDGNTASPSIGRIDFRSN